MATKKKMSVSEAGRKGGLKVKRTYGKAFFEEIGRKGGKKGGQAVKQKYGSPYFEEIGRKGGRKVKQLIEKGKKAS